jgi:predicted transcriptional regulator
MRRLSTEVDSKPPPVGQQELALVRFVEASQPLSLRTISDDFGETNGLARTTIHTMLERLRKKRVLSRSKKDGVFVYRVSAEAGDVLTSAVGAFVEKTLGGSVIPFVAYLAKSKDLKSEEIEALRRVVEEMRRDGA